jgi:ribosomal protein L4
MKRKATMIALSEKVKADNFKVIDNITPTEQKTKSFAGAFKKLKLAGKILVAFSEHEQDLRRYCRNIRNTSVTLTKDLNVHDLLGNKMLVLSKDSVAQLEKQFGVKEAK